MSRYFSNGWHSLRRNARSLACASIGQISSFRRCGTRLADRYFLTHITGVISRLLLQPNWSHLLPWLVEDDDQRSGQTLIFCRTIDRAVTLFERLTGLFPRAKALMSIFHAGLLLSTRRDIMSNFVGPQPKYRALIGTAAIGLVITAVLDS